MALVKHLKILPTHGAGSSKEFVDDGFAGFLLGFAGSSNRLRVQQMANLDAVVQVRPVNRETARFERPVGALLGRGFGQPFQPRHSSERDADFPAIVKQDVQRVRRDARSLGTHMFAGFSGRSIHSMPPIVLFCFVLSVLISDSTLPYYSRDYIQLRVD